MPFSDIAALRAARDQKLKDSDFLMLPDAPECLGSKAAIAAYRTSLRELPNAVAEVGLENVELPDERVLTPLKDAIAAEQAAAESGSESE